MIIQIVKISYFLMLFYCKTISIQFQINKKYIWINNINTS